MEKKLESLKEIIKSLESTLVAYSGGVDSTFLAKVAYDVLSHKSLAITIKTEVHPDWEFEEAIEMAKKLGFSHETINIKALTIPQFESNPPDRCYYCKKEILTILKQIAEKRGFRYVIEGSNMDDLKDHRPGMLALKEAGVRSPLKEAGLTKADIRELSKILNLPTWDKPSFACLASRFPYGTKITQENLKIVDEGESFLRSLGIRQLRLRHHGDIARIEVPENDIKIILENREHIIRKFKDIGYKYVSLDLQGYRTGSLNEVL